MSLIHDFLNLAAYLRTPLSVDEGRAMIGRHVEQRETLFLTALRDRCYADGSPYRALLDAAGCAYRDVEAMVRQRGMEPTLDALYRAGVYLSFDEFKNGAEVRRGARTFRFTPAQFDPPRQHGVVSIRSGGTRSAGTWVALPIGHLAVTHTPQLGLTLAMLADRDAPVITWQLGFPSGAGLASWFSLAKLQRPARRWFSLTPVPRGIGSRRQMMFWAARLLARGAGVRVPSPVHTPVAMVERVLGAILEAVAGAGACVVITTPSCAVRLAGEAARQGGTLRGVLFLAGGEPLTADKLADIRRAGARVASHYSVTEAGGSVGAPCGTGEPGDMHFRSDALAMITRPRQIGDVTVDALMLTSLLPTAPKVLLNVETDDFAHISERPCGCPWDELGCRTHLREVRSYTKLTGEGTTLLGSNCVQIIEQVLPRTFGGTSVDYQLLEAEDGQHLTRLFLLVSPRVGVVDDAAVLQRFIEALQATATQPLGGRRPIWEQAGSIRIVRRDPIPTGAGKLLPFHTLGASSRLPWRTPEEGS